MHHYFSLLAIVALGAVLSHGSSGAGALGPNTPPTAGQALLNAATSAGAAASAPPAMVEIPAGTFQMGSHDADSSERPVHPVSVNRFFMDRTEVTVAQYRACVQAGRCTLPVTRKYCNWSEGAGAKDNHPINCVDWNQATAFCGWAGKRLPTEEEWEYAARGTDGRKYPWGNEAPAGQLCWNRWESKEGTCAVGAYPAGKSPFGVEDMAGNVWEWTSSQYSESYSQSRTNEGRMIRGGSWHEAHPDIVRGAFRYRNEPSFRNVFIGFRCAR